VLGYRSKNATKEKERREKRRKEKMYALHAGTIILGDIPFFCEAATGKPSERFAGAGLVFLTGSAAW